MTELPERVQRARSKANEVGFEFSCDDDVGRLLAFLAAGVRPGGRILELGTGAGVGTAWLVDGVGGSEDVELVSVEADPTTADVARSQSWPAYVEFVIDDAVRVLPSLGRFDLVFADAPGGKWHGLDLSVAALTPGGMLVVDDMTPQDSWSAEQVANNAQVRRALREDSQLTSLELDWSTGVIMSVTRRRGRRIA